MLYEFLLKILFGNNDEFGIVFPAVSAFLGVIIGGVISGASTFIATRYQSQKTIQQSEKNRRREIANTISKILTNLFTTTAKNLTIPFLDDDYDRLWDEMTDSYYEALAARHQYAYCLPQNIQKDIQEFLDNTHENLKRSNRWVEATEKEGKPLTLQESQGLLPHQDQIDGIAGKAFEKVCSDLNAYVENDNA